MLALPLDDPRRQRLLRTLEQAFDALDLADVSGTAATAREILAPALALPSRSGAHRTVAVGHAHIDTAWLWPLRETVRKCTRTFASALRLMDDYPDYRFVCSQAAQYEWMRERHPALFAGIQEKAAAGQWIPVGGMWVETDANIPSGESIVRQLVHGQRFFEEHFGRRCREVWIPDVFGYPASLPQIFAAAGCDRFVTQKLSWNKENRFPHSTFWWEGIDGSRVLTHFPPVETYNAMIVPAEQTDLVRNFHEHGWSDWSLTPYGHGNGGGGPTREMVERARRMADLDGLPRLELGTVDGFFEAVEAEAADRRTRAGVAGRAVLRDAPRHADQPGDDEGGQPPQRAPPARGRAVVDDARLARRGGGGARPPLEGPAGPAVPRHPSGLVDRLGPRRRRGRARADHRASGEADRSGALPAWRRGPWPWRRPGAEPGPRWSWRR